VRLVRLVAVGWWLQLKMRARSSFDGLLSLVWPLFFATTVFLMYRERGQAGGALLSAALGASVMGVWSATSTTAAGVLQRERRQGTLELLVAAPVPFPYVVVPLTLSMATVGAYSIVTTLLWGRIVFGIHLAVRDPVGFVAAIAVTVLAIGMLGFLIAIGSVRYRTAWALGNALEMPVWLICGFLVPIAQLPAWVRPVSWLLAPTWGMAAIRAAATGGDPLVDLVLCAVLALGYGAVGAWASKRLLDSARARATLALT
jgi:ABC-2 type transport system permease protein